MGKSVTKIVFSKVISVFVFLLFLGALNFLARYITFSTFISFTNFFNRNALLLIGINFIFMFAELLSQAEFPSNIFNPVLNFIGAWMLLRFVFAFFEGVQRRFQFDFLETIFLIKTPIFLGILSLIFIFGYLPIIYKLLKEKNQSVENREPQVIEKIKVIPQVVEKEKVIKKDLKSRKRKKNGSRK